MNTERNANPANNSSGEVRTTHETGINTALTKDKGQTAVPIDLNKHLVSRAKEICDYTRERRTGGHTSDILPPICYIEHSLYDNINNVLNCFSHTLAAALHSEAQYIATNKSLEDLGRIVDTEKRLIFDFLSENNLIEKFKEWAGFKKRDHV